jgi:hypothetical protein
VLLDLKLADSSDLGLLRTLRQRVPRSQVILRTSRPEVADLCRTHGITEQAPTVGRRRVAGWS